MHNDSAQALAKVSNTLGRTKAQCSECKEAKMLFSCLHERLKNAHDIFQKTPTTPDIRDLNATSLGEQVALFDELVSTYAAASLASRVILYKKADKELREIHDLLDGMFRRLGHAMYEEHSVKWKTDYESDLKHVETELGKAIDEWDGSEEAAGASLALREALTTLRYARDSRLQLQWHALAWRMLETLVRQPGATRYPDVVPRWYIPIGDVRYKQKHFAKGSFGTIHHGTWGPGTDVVVKRLLTDGNKPLTPAEQDKFMEEANLWYMLGHPYVLRMFGGCHVSAPPFLVCDNAVNGNLPDYLAMEKMNNQDNPDYVKRTWRLLYQAALGIEYLHKKSIVHGDLKMNNILVGSDTYSKVADFGLSRMKQSYESMTKAPTPEVEAGALRWRAPECFNGVLPQPSSDVFSFGMCIIEAVLGETPYGSLDDASARERILAGQLPELPADMPEGVMDLIKKMTSKEPTDRISINEAIMTLKKLAQEEDREERKRVKVCATCLRRMRQGSADCDYCNRKNVPTTTIENEDVVIKSAKDIPRALNILTLDDPQQRALQKKAVGALRDYVFGSPHRQFEVKMAGSMPVLLDRVKKADDSPELEIQLEGVISTGCVMAGNPDVLETAIFEDAIPRVADTLATATSSETKLRAAMVMGHLAALSDNATHDVRMKEDVMANINRVLQSTEGFRKAGLDQSLRFLLAPAGGA